jgi:hypothetical protein
MSMTNGKRRRLFVLILALCLVVIAGVMVQMWLSLRGEAIGYGATILPATPEAVCAGGAFTYPVSIVVAGGNSVSRVTEGWCRADGICPRVLQQLPYYVNFVAGITVETTARRVAPDTLTPGEWELRHCNETHSSGNITVVCYAVPLTIKDCE